MGENGQELIVTAEDELPDIKGIKKKAGEINIPPKSILFLTIDKYSF